MHLDFGIIFIFVAALSASCSSNPVIYRVNVAEPEIIDQQQQQPLQQDGNGKWMSNTRNNYFRDVISRIHPDSTYMGGRDTVGRSSNGNGHATQAMDCKHPHYVPSYGGNVGQTGYSRYPANYPYPYQGGGGYPYQGYPIYYYIVPQQPVSSQQQQQKQPIQLHHQQQQQPLSNEQYLKQPGQYEKIPVSTVSPHPPPSKQQTPISGYSPVPYPQYPTSTWQNYLCSAFPYLSSCQGQTQQQSQFVSPYGYQPYPGYQQMAQYPVYYIVQPEVKGQSGVLPVGPTPIGVIKVITGSSPVKPDIPVGEKPIQVEVVDVKNEGASDVKPGEEEDRTSTTEASEEVKKPVKD